MKAKTLLPLFCIILSSCDTTIKFSSTTSYIDFRPYAKKGFFISTSPYYPKEHESIAYIDALVSSGADDTNPDIKEIYINGGAIKFRPANIRDAIEGLYQQAVELGADGLNGLSFNRSDSDGYPKITASGMAIKRK
jgi:hypothetical protein